VIATVHGLDVILPIQWYQSHLKKSLAKIDKIVCVSRATAAEVTVRGIAADRIAIIPNAAEICKNYMSAVRRSMPDCRS